MNTGKIVALAALTAVGCAGSQNAGPKRNPDLTVSIGKENVRVGERTFAIGDADSMRAGFAGGCAKGCQTVEIRAIPMARFDAMLASYTAAVDNEAGHIWLRIATSEPVKLAVGNQGSPSAPCPAEIALRHKQIDVYVNGEVLPPAAECEHWGATICDSGEQDPLKRTELEQLRPLVSQFRNSFADRTCIYVESEMPAMLVDRLLHTVKTGTDQPTTFSLRRDRMRGRLAETDVTQAIVDQSKTLSACYDAELDKGSRKQMEAVVRFLIGPSGNVLRAEMRDSARTNETFDACLLDAVRTLKFPRPENGGAVEITYPLRFAPRPGLKAD